MPTLKDAFEKAAAKKQAQDKEAQDQVSRMRMAAGIMRLAAIQVSTHRSWTDYEERKPVRIGGLQ